MGIEVVPMPPEGDSRTTEFSPSQHEVVEKQTGLLLQDDEVRTTKQTNNRLRNQLETGDVPDPIGNELGPLHDLGVVP